MDAAKIQLSADELLLVQNAEWLLTKNSIIEKVYVLFGELAQQMSTGILKAAKPMPEAVLASSPKISKGEKYEGLPWVMLDYPRVFGKEDTWAIRTFFWWGHFFTITLQLKGTYKQQYLQALLQNITVLKQHDFYIGIADEWQHHFREENYKSLHQLDSRSIEEMLSRNEFCKFSAKIPLHQWEQAYEILGGKYRVLLELLGH
jgi:hypothetical protein